MTRPNVFHATSVEDVKQRQNVWTLLHGEKRSHDRLHATSPHGAILGDNTNSANQSAQESAKRPRMQVLPKSCIEASRIRSVAEPTGAPKPGLGVEQTINPTPGPSQNPLLSLHHPRYGLPKTLVNNLALLGINSIYAWQSSCLLGRGILEGKRSLVYTAPTGGGKSLIADVLMLKKIVQDPAKKAILVLPYVALVQEKLKWLRKVVDGVSKNDSAPDQPGFSNGMMKKYSSGAIRTVGFFGGSRTKARWSDFDIAVCTIEKANGLVNTAIENGSIKDLGVLVMDELHMINDNHRGYLMEVMASKILTLEHYVQVVAMSATLTNTETLATWLNAKYYNTNYVPVPVEEFLVYDRSIYATSISTTPLNSTQAMLDMLPVRQIEKSNSNKLKNSTLDAVVALAVETAVAGSGALVFCSARQGCQSTAVSIAEAMPYEIDEVLPDRREDVISELRSLPVGLDETLERTIIHRVAFHHAGLTVEERDIVANAYDRGVIKVIVATCSLAAGINLPARRVILQGARMGRDFVGPAMLRQMRGRAGRKGKDEIGESYLCCEKTDLEEVLQLLAADLPTVESSLTPEQRGIKRALLEVVTIRLATHREAIDEYVQRTLLHHTMNHEQLKGMVDTSLRELIESNLIIVDKFGGYEATLLGQATVASYLTPEDGLFLHAEFQRALRAFAMDGEMHIFYLFTPVTLFEPADIDWVIFRNEIEKLDDSGLRVLIFVGISPALVNRMANSAPPSLPSRTPSEIHTARIHRRFYTALQLRDLCNELPIHLVARKYNLPRGSVQTLSSLCEGFAAGMIQFCDIMGWGMLKAALGHMADRLRAGARGDLLELARLPFVKSATARVFWESGLRGLRAVAEMEPGEVVGVLVTAQPLKLRLSAEEEARHQRKLLLKAEIIVSAANKLWERDQQQQQLEIEADL